MNHRVLSNNIIQDGATFTGIFRDVQPAVPSVISYGTILFEIWIVMGQMDSGDSCSCGGESEVVSPLPGSKPGQSLARYISRLPLPTFFFFPFLASVDSTRITGHIPVSLWLRFPDLLRLWHICLRCGVLGWHRCEDCLFSHIDHTQWILLIALLIFSRYNGMLPVSPTPRHVCTAGPAG